MNLTKVSNLSLAAITILFLLAGLTCGSAAAETTLEDESPAESGNPLPATEGSVALHDRISDDMDA